MSEPRRPLEEVGVIRGITVELDVDVPMRDGVTLRANVFRPPSGRSPTLLTRLPYSKDGRWSRDVLEPVAAAARSYSVVVQDTRGCFASEGEWHPYRHEIDDGQDTVDWITRQPWCDGSVGMYGASYYGYTQWAAAEGRPAGLSALVPFIAAGSSTGKVGATGGGVPDFGMHLLWDMQMQLASQLRSGLAPGDPKVRSLISAIDSIASAGYRERLLGDTGNGLLSTPPPPIDYGSVAVPALHVGAWFDIFLEETLAAFAAQRRSGVPAKLLVGPWTHLDRYDPIGELVYGLSSEIDWIDLAESFADIQLAWFDHWLKRIDNGVMSEPPVRIFVMGRNAWRDEDDWPPPRAVMALAYLRTGGRLEPEPPRTEPPDAFDARRSEPVPTLGGATMLAPPLRAGPFDQRAIATRTDVLEYATAPLRRDVEVTGPVRVRLFVRCDSAPFDLVARLLDVGQDGRAINLTDSIARISAGTNAAGHATECVLDLAPTSNLFRAGHRIGLHVTWSSFPRWLPAPTGNAGRVPGTVAYEILHDSEHLSRLEVLVIGEDSVLALVPRS